MNISITKKSILTAAIVIPMLSAVLIGTNNILQPAQAQIPGGTFNAKGYTGQIIVLPPSMTQLPNPSHPAAPPVGSIIGGNWSVDVSNGQVKNFTWDVKHYTLSGKVNGTFQIVKLTNTTGAVQPRSSPTIVLEGNHTQFSGNADIVINGKPAFTNVPIVFYLLNGKLVNLTISSAKTNNFFPLPLFGIVTSLK